MARTEPPFQDCFVIMSFSEASEAAYEQGIKPAVEGLGFQPVRIDKADVVGDVIKATTTCLETAYFVIADLTEERPNCYYELGFAHAIRGNRDSVLVARDSVKIHFDIAGQQVHKYRTPQELCQRLRQTIVRAILMPPSTRPRDRDDPHRGRFGGCAIDMERGRLLTATVLDRQDGKWMSEEQKLAAIRLEVAPLSGARPVKGGVTFHLHDSFGRPRLVQPQDGFATCEIRRVEGAFTVGVTIDGEKTRLELDLGRLPAQPKEFYGS